MFADGPSARCAFACRAPPRACARHLGTPGEAAVAHVPSRDGVGVGGARARRGVRATRRPRPGAPSLRRAPSAGPGSAVGRAPRSGSAARRARPRSRTAPTACAHAGGEPRPRPGGSEVVAPAGVDRGTGAPASTTSSTSSGSSSSRKAEKRAIHAARHRRGPRPGGEPRVQRAATGATRRREGRPEAPAQRHQAPPDQRALPRRRRAAHRRRRRCGAAEGDEANALDRAAAFLRRLRRSARRVRLRRRRGDGKGDRGGTVCLFLFLPRDPSARWRWRGAAPRRSRSAAAARASGRAAAATATRGAVPAGKNEKRDRRRFGAPGAAAGDGGVARAFGARACAADRGSRRRVPRVAFRRPLHGAGSQGARRRYREARGGGAGARSRRGARLGGGEPRRAATPRQREASVSAALAPTRATPRRVVVWARMEQRRRDARARHPAARRRREHARANEGSRGGGQAAKTAVAAASPGVLRRPGAGLARCVAAWGARGDGSTRRGPSGATRRRRVEPRRRGDAPSDARAWAARPRPRASSGPRRARAVARASVRGASGIPGMKKRLLQRLLRGR